MVFENLEGAFSGILTHTSFISRKVGFSRRCPHARCKASNTTLKDPPCRERAPVVSVDARKSAQEIEDARSGRLYHVGAEIPISISSGVPLAYSTYTADEKE